MTTSNAFWLNASCSLSSASFIAALPFTRYIWGEIITYALPLYSTT
jgi:hypothetical protein